MTGTHVDIVDIAPLFGSDPQARSACDRALWDGFRRTGAVVIRGYPEADRVDARARTGLKIFDLPDAGKHPLITRHEAPGNRHWYRGLWPCTKDRFLQNDMFDVGPDHPAPGPDLPGTDILTEPTPWPAQHPVPGWADTVRAHYRHLNTVAQALILAIGREAGFPEDAIAERFAGEHSTLRFLNYPADATSPSKEEDGARVSGGRHTDASGLSLLWQAQPGLQAQGQDGVFRDIPMVANAISVHVGDVMTRMTDGAVPATPHRVLAGTGPRQSVGFFLEPALSAPVTPVTYRGPKRVQDTYGWQLLETFARRPVWIRAAPGLERRDRRSGRGAVSSRAFVIPASRPTAAPAAGPARRPPATPR